MKKSQEIKALFVDVGGVLLTNGWDAQARQQAAKKFGLNAEEMESRHRLTFDTYEVGKLSLEDYVKRIVFYEDRPFSSGQFQEFMFAQSKPYPQMIALIRKLKAQFGLKIVVVSNEGRELNEYRIQKFKLNTFVDCFISSCFVHYRKPDEDIYRIALDIAQIPPDQVLYLEDRQMFVEVAESLGIHGLRHVDHKSTVKKLFYFGLKILDNK